MSEKEKELVSKLREGDHQAYKSLFNQYYELLVAYSLKYQQDIDVARDIAQRTITNIFEKNGR
ncbi:MAG: RNA polymerase sigma-70 factor (ECF subfamily) [Cyclobacteriaceae bacterium]|jgi:RNA polymerase sigma-70 factor (ECF subfamily)